MPRLLMVDDSAFVRLLFQRRWAERGWQVTCVKDGRDALEVWAALRPDLVTMDVEMPVVNGVDATAAMRRAGYRGPLVMVSTLTVAGARVTLDALAAGADDFIPKPEHPSEIDAAIDAIAARYEALLRARSVSRLPFTGSPGRPVRTRPLSGICVAASTGGPRAIGQLLAGQPTPPCPIAIIQHMPAGFTAAFAEQLEGLTGWRVREAPVDGTRLPWTHADAVVAPGGRHLRVSATEAWSVEGPRLHGVIPSADVTLADAIRTWGDRLGIIVLTGMGSDGALVARDAHRAGAVVVAESEETTTVYGMPRAAVEAGAADAVWPLPRIRQWLGEVLERRDGVYRLSGH
jgi:two-component system chemotaxis response regulator CheB